MESLRVQIHPRIIPWSPDRSLDPAIATLGIVPNRVAVSITGGCAKANTPYSEGSKILKLFTKAFNGFAGALLVGGTRMILDDDPDRVLFGITEVGPAIRAHCPNALVLGVIPRFQEVRFCQEASILKVVQAGSEPDMHGHTTIVHPDQDMVVGIGKPLLSQLQRWDDEVEFRRYVTHLLRTHGDWRSLLIAYNGGEVTEREVRATASRDWPVVLIKGSGRATDKLAADKKFLRQHPSVIVCDHSAASLRRVLIDLKVVTKTGSR